MLAGIKLGADELVDLKSDLNREAEEGNRLTMLRG